MHCSLLHRVLFIIICAIVFFGREATTLCCIVLVWFGSVLLVASMRWMNESRMRCMYVLCVYSEGFWGIVQQSGAFGNAHLCGRVYCHTIWYSNMFCVHHSGRLQCHYYMGCFHSIPIYTITHIHIYLCVCCVHAFFVPNLVFEAKYFSLATHKFVM